jgi:hypothetical protein
MYSTFLSHYSCPPHVVLSCCRLDGYISASDVVCFISGSLLEVRRRSWFALVPPVVMYCFKIVMLDTYLFLYESIEVVTIIPMNLAEKCSTM